jgi:ABC-type nitrate/sulfonate/bicarbonate transport system substrate-binding protein
MRRLKVILFRAAYNLPVTVGVARGVFAKHDLELEISYTKGSQMTSAVLLSGECDVGALAADDVVYEVEAHGSDLFAFIGLHGGILALVAHKILASLGLGAVDYETVAMGGQEFRAKAMDEGRIDVTLSTPPFSLELAARGFTLLAQARDYVPRYQASCAVATRRYARKNRDALAAYGKAYRESLAWTLDPANREACVHQLTKEFGLRPQLAAATFDALLERDGLFPDARIDVPGFQTVLALRVDAGLLKAPAPDPRKYFDDGLLEG